MKSCRAATRARRRRPRGGVPAPAHDLIARPPARRRPGRRPRLDGPPCARGPRGRRAGPLGVLRGGLPRTACPGGAGPHADGVRARSGPRDALHRVPPPDVQDPGLPQRGGGPQPHAPLPQPRGLSGRAQHRRRPAAQRAPVRGPGPGARPRASALRPSRGGRPGRPDGGARRLPPQRAGAPGGGPPGAALPRSPGPQPDPRGARRPAQARERARLAGGPAAPPRLPLPRGPGRRPERLDRLQQARPGGWAPRGDVHRGGPALGVGPLAPRRAGGRGAPPGLPGRQPRPEAPDRPGHQRGPGPVHRRPHPHDRRGGAGPGSRQRGRGAGP